MVTVSIVYRSRAEDRSRQAYATNFWVMSLPNYANYALHQLAKDNAKYNKNLAKSVQQHFYIEDTVLKTVKKSQKQSKSTKDSKPSQQI